MGSQKSIGTGFLDSRSYLPGLLIALSCIVYANSLNSPFIFDDEPNILQNSHVRSIWPITKAMSAPPKSGVDGRPIVSVTLAINYALCGYNVWGYHVFNLFTHIFAGIILFAVVQRTLLTDRLKRRFGEHAAVLAWAVATIWVLHPIQTGSVTYIIQRAESLMGLFYLLTLYAAIRTMDSKHPFTWSALSMLCCGLGMATKEAMVAAPVLVLLYDRTFVGRSFASAIRQRWFLYTGLASTWIILVMLLRAGARFEGAGFSLGIGPLDYALNQGPIIIHYLRLSFWPTNLCLDYGWPANRDLLELLPSVLAISVMLAITVIGLVRNLSWSFPAVWIFAILAPTSSFVPVLDLAFEHRMYLPLAGLITLVILAGYNLLTRMAKTTAATALVVYRAGVIAILIVAAGFGVRTVVRNNDYRSSISIWQATAKTAPQNPRVYLNLGKALHLAGRIDEAIEQYTTAIEHNPDYTEVHVNLGASLKRQGKLDAAIKHYRKALQIKPDMAEAYYNLANALEMQGKLEEAIAHHTKALTLNRHLHQAHYALADILSSQGRYGPAIPHYRSALNAKPQDPYLHSQLAAALAKQGRIDEAIAHYEQALKIKPDLVEAKNRLDALPGQTRPAGNNY